MTADDSTAAPKGFLGGYPTTWLIAPTLFLLFGQAVAASPIIIPPFSLVAILFPLPLFFRRGQRAWAVLTLLGLLAFSLGYVLHR